MTEAEYIITGNLAKLRTVQGILGDVLPGDSYGVPIQDFAVMVSAVRRLADGANKALPELSQ